MMAQGRNLLDIFDALWDNADVMEEILWLCFLGNFDTRSLNVPLALDSIQPRSPSAPAWRGISPAVLVALLVTAALHEPVLSLLHVLCDVPALQAVLVLLWALRIECYEMCSARSGWRRWFLRLTGRFASLRWFTGPYLQLTRWSPDLDTRIFVLRGWASKGNV